MDKADNELSYINHILTEPYLKYNFNLHLTFVHDYYLFSFQKYFKKVKLLDAGGVFLTHHDIDAE